MRLEYSTDICGQEILQDEHGIHQVMMEWEHDYMKACIDKLQPTGNVLEIGFGLGYSATHIQTYDISSHTIIECNPVVLEKLKKWAEDKPTVNIVQGRWEDMLQTLDTFDTIFFDDYDGEKNDPGRFIFFMYDILLHHTHINSRIVVYSGNEIQSISEIPGVLTLEQTKHAVVIPKYCVYECQKDHMWIPLFTKIGEYKKDQSLINNKHAHNIQEKISNNINEIISQKLSTEGKNKIIDIPKPTPTISATLIIVDNFYNNAMETRNYILTQDFSVKGNYPGQRTKSFATEELKNMFQNYVEPHSGKITRFDLNEENNYNGAFQYTTSRDRSWLHTDGWNNWAAVVFMTPDAPLTAGTGLYMYEDGTRYVDEHKWRNNKELLDRDSQDITKWKLVDRVGNVFNRLVLFNAKHYHTSLDYFGSNKEDGRLFQTFFFSTER